MDAIRDAKMDPRHEPLNELLDGESAPAQAEDDHPLLQMGEDLRPTTIKRKR